MRRCSMFKFVIYLQEKMTVKCLIDPGVQEANFKATFKVSYIPTRPTVLKIMRSFGSFGNFVTRFGTIVDRCLIPPSIRNAAVTFGNFRDVDLLYCDFSNAAVRNAKYVVCVRSCLPHAFGDPTNALTRICTPLHAHAHTRVSIVTSVTHFLGGGGRR